MAPSARRGTRPRGTACEAVAPSQRRSGQRPARRSALPPVFAAACRRTCHIRARVGQALRFRPGSALPPAFVATCMPSDPNAAAEPPPPIFAFCMFRPAIPGASGQAPAQALRSGRGSGARGAMVPPARRGANLRAVVPPASRSAACGTVLPPASPWRRRGTRSDPARARSGDQPCRPPSWRDAAAPAAHAAAERIRQIVKGSGPAPARFVAATFRPPARLRRAARDAWPRLEPPG